MKNYRFLYITFIYQVELDNLYPFLLLGVSDAVIIDF